LGTLLGLKAVLAPVTAQDATPLRPTVDDLAASQADTLPPDDLTAQAPLSVPPLPDVPPPRPRKKSTNDPYAPLGVDTGGVIFYPAIEFGTTYSTNASQSATKARAAVGLHLRPSLRWASDWVRHSWEGEASADLVDYLRSGIPAAKQGHLSSRARLDIRHTTRADWQAGYDLQQTGAGNSEIPATAVGDRTDQTFATSVALIHDFGGLEGDLRLGLTRETYGSVKLQGGGSEDNGDRDTVTPSLGLRLAYSDAPAVKPFIGVEFAPRIHDRKHDRNGLNRNSRGLTFSLGATLLDDPIWQGEAALVYMRRNYSDPTLKANDAVGINGNLTWAPTDITTVMLNAATDLTETSTAGVSGGRTHSVGVSLTQAVRENVDIIAGLGLQFDKTSAGTDKTFTSKLALEWQINPEMVWTASYDGTWLRAASSADNYNEQKISTGIVFRR
jgi:hypothetical protein